MHDKYTPTHVVSSDSETMGWEMSPHCPRAAIDHVM